MKFLLIFALTIITTQTYGQINLEDSTVQVIGFWEKEEQQNYFVSLEKIKDSDTISRELIKYDVEITIKDSTSNSYLIEWRYTNFDIETSNNLMQRIASLSDNMKIVIKTDEFGAIQEVVNWQEVSAHMESVLNKLKDDFKEIPKLDQILSQVETLYSSKQAIEDSSIEDAQQFYTFHGAKYKLDETLEFQSKGPNIFGGEPFDVDALVYLDEINGEDHNYILRAEQSVNPEQLTEATVKYMTELSKKVGGQPFNREGLEDLSNEVITASRIHDSGWVIYTIQTKTVNSGNVTNVEERIIEIK